MVILNAGNNFEHDSKDNQIAPRYILSALEQIGIEVIGPGPEEILFGVENLKKISSQTSIPVISANVTGFQPYAVLSKNRGQTKILVTSVVDPALLSNIKGIRDPIEALDRIEREVKHDMLIVIIYAEKERISSIIASCPGIDLMIDGHSDTVSENRGPDMKTPVVANNEKGTYVSYIDYCDNDNDHYFSDPVNLRATVGEVAEDLQIQALVKTYEKEKRDYFIQKAREKNQPAMRLSGNPFIGSQSCSLCHSVIDESWQKTKHANAMTSLMKKGSEYDPDCLSCHTTGNAGYKKAGEFLSMNESSLMTGVQCEACHGPGAEHVKNPMATNMSPITENTCKRCHTTDKDPRFDFSNEISMVNHGQIKVGGIFWK